MKQTCSACEADADIIRGDYQYKESGLDNVVLRNMKLVKCPVCGNVDPLIPRVTELHRVLAQAIIREPYRLNGSEIRFLRKYMHMTAEKLASVMNVDKTTISKWENDQDPIGDQSDRLLRLIALSIGKLGDKPEDLIGSFSAISGAGKHMGIRVDAERLDYEYAA
jgi:putative zinc finger/helix-turn-helix YgiT family protein